MPPAGLRGEVKVFISNIWMDQIWVCSHSLSSAWSLSVGNVKKWVLLVDIFDLILVLQNLCLFETFEFPLIEVIVVRALLKVCYDSVRLELVGLFFNLLVDTLLAEIDTTYVTIVQVCRTRKQELFLVENQFCLILAPATHDSFLLQLEVLIVYESQSVHVSFELQNMVFMAEAKVTLLNGTVVQYIWVAIHLWKWGRAEVTHALSEILEDSWLSCDGVVDLADFRLV